MATFSSAITLAFFGVSNQVNDGDASDVVLLVPTVKTLAWVLAGLGLELGWAVAHLDPCGWSQGHGPGLGIFRSKINSLKLDNSQYRPWWLSGLASIKIK